MLTHASLFSGIGGFDLAASWAGFDNLFNCEIDPFCKRLLKYYWPKATQYDDIKKTDFTLWHGRVDVLTGGFPCQPFSHAGKRNGTSDDRYLWPEYLRAIREIQPSFVVGENVTGILSMGEREVFAQVDSRTIVRYADFDHYEAVYTRQEKLLVTSICQDLEKEGYQVQVFAIPAAGVGAPHKRERIWFVATRINSNRSNTRVESLQQRGQNGICRFKYAPYATSARLQNRQQIDGFTNSKKAISGMEFWNKQLMLNGNVAYANVNRLERGTYNGGSYKIRTKRYKQFTGLFSPTWKNFPTQSPVCGGDDGLPAELDGITVSNWRNNSIKGFGNAVVPHIPYRIFKSIEAFYHSPFTLNHSPLC